MELPVLEIAQPRRKTLSDQSEEGKYMIARTSGIGKVLLDLQDGVVVEQAVENIGCLALGRADRQNAEIAVQIGKVAVKFRAWLAAIMQVDITAFGGTITGPEELTIR